MAELQLHNRKAKHAQRLEAPVQPGVSYHSHRVKVSVYREGDDIDAFISRFERTTVFYTIQVGLFSDKALQILHMLPADHDFYNHLKAVMQKTFGRTAELLFLIKIHYFLLVFIMHFS